MASRLAGILICLITSTSLHAQNFNDWTKYAESLEKCSAGTFNLPDPVEFSMTRNFRYTAYQIMGLNNGICEVVIRNPSGEGSTTTFLCLFTSQQLGVIAQYARLVAAGNVDSASSDNVATLTQSQCKLLTQSEAMEMKN